jgi:MFS family permease
MPSSFVLWTAVLLVSTITLGNYFLFDLPGAIGMGKGHTWERQFHKAGETYTQTMNGLLYSVYSWPNLVLAMLGGIIVDDVLGIQRSAILFTVLVLAGAFVTYCGVHYVSFPLLIAGRVIFGLGGETQIVAQYSYIGNWFSERGGAGFAFGIVAALQRVGAGATFWVGPRVAQSDGVEAATLCSVIISAGCVASLLLVTTMHDCIATRVKEPATHTFRSIIAHAGHAATPGVVRLAVANALVSMALYGFAAIAVNLLEVRSNLDAKASGEAVTGFYIVVVITAPLFGYMVDRVGRHVEWLCGAAAFAAVVTAMLAENMLSGAQYCQLLAVAQAVVLSTVYPLVARYTEIEHEGFAFGIVVSTQNAGMALATLVNGALLDYEDGIPLTVRYQRVILCQAALYAAAAVVFSSIRRLPVVTKAESAPLLEV